MIDRRDLCMSNGKLAACAIRVQKESNSHMRVLPPQVTGRRVPCYTWPYVMFFVRPEKNSCTGNIKHDPSRNANSTRDMYMYKAVYARISSLLEISSQIIGQTECIHRDINRSATASRRGRQISAGGTRSWF